MEIYFDEWAVGTPEFLNALDKNKITPWRRFAQHHSFRIESERITDVEITNTLRLLQQYGICHFRLINQNSNDDTLRAYFSSIGQVMSQQNDFYGDIKNLEPKPDVEPNTGSSAGDLGFHVDGTQHADQPALLAFHYLVTADIQGNSRFVDIASVLFDLPDDVRERVLLKLSQPDVAVFEKKGMRLESPVFHFPDGESLACRIRIDDVIQVKEECREEFEILRKALLAPMVGITFKPRPGDIVIFDNWRLLHARDTILGKTQRSHNRVWMEALLPEHQAEYHLGIRPIPIPLKAKMMEQQK